MMNDDDDDDIVELEAIITIWIIFGCLNDRMIEAYLQMFSFVA